MKKGFTLIELLVVITIIAILAGLTLGAGGVLRDKAARSRAQAELAAFGTALERYKIDNGDYPDVGASKATMGAGGGLYSNNSQNYVQGSASSATESAGVLVGTSVGKALFTCLMGRSQFTQTAKSSIAYPQYMEVKTGQVGNPEGESYFKDPYNNAYGYYYDAAKESGPDGNQASIFNVVEPDMWSTGGQSAAASTDSGNAVQYAVYLKWIKNWASQ